MWMSVVWMALGVLLAASPARAADNPSRTLELVQRRGALVVGVKNDYPPFSSLDASGALQGLEVDMAADLARRLGVGLRLVAVSSANRLQKLEDGSVDMVIATMGDTAERRRIATVVEPNYYASGVTLFTRPGTRLSDWQEIRGKTVCAIQGSYFNRAMSQRYLLNLLMFNNGRDARLAVRDGRCIGMLYDQTAIWADLQRPEWAGYKASLPPAMVVAWSIALARHEAGSPLERRVGDAVADWHRSGFLIEREKAWGLPPSRFLADTHALWSQRSGSDWFCRREAHGGWSAACRNRALLTPQEVGGLHQVGLKIKEATGWDLSFIYDDFDRQRFLLGLWHSVLLMLGCVLGSLLVGVGGALLAESRLRLLGPACRALAVWGRMTPPLLQMYLLFFGLGALLWDTRGISLSAWAIAIGCLSYYTGASVMSALLDAAQLQRERDPGFRLRWRTVPRVYGGGAAGSITASLVNVCKATTMASVIAVPELLAAATGIVSDSGNVGEMMNMMLLTFLLLIALTVRLLQRLEAWVRRCFGEPS